MDANVLLECFAGTLQANQGVRQQAELKLKELSVTPGFLGGCLDIIGSSNSNLIDPNVCKAAAVYFKNRIVRYWRPSERSNSAPQGSTGTVFIDNDEKPIIKERILQVIVSSDYHIKQQLIPVLRVLVSFEFPKNWPTLLNDTGSLLQQVPSAADPANPILDEVNYSQLYTGLLCFSEVCRNFRWVKNEDRELELDPIIQQVFPHLLNIGNSIVQHPNEITEFKAEIIKLILKIYKFVTYYDLPKVLQTREAVFSWGSSTGRLLTYLPHSMFCKRSTAQRRKSPYFKYLSATNGHWLTCTDCLPDICQVGYLKGTTMLNSTRCS